MIPLVVFYLAMWAFGIWGALAAGLAWAYGAIAYRMVRGKRVSGMLVVGALGLTARTVISMASGSVFIYFLQPTLGTIAVAATFLFSVPAGRPFAQKMAADFCPLPDAFRSHPRVQEVFGRISILWGMVFVTNAVMTVYLLMSQSLGVYLLVKTVASAALSGLAITVSVWWFIRSMRADGIPVTRAA